MTWATLVVTLLPVLGCSSLQVTDPASPYYIPSPGSIVTIHQHLEVPAGETRLFMQSGKIVGKGGLSEFEVNCNFEINTLTQQPRYIAPGAYTITRTTRSRESIVQGPVLAPMQLASVSLGIRMGQIHNPDGPPMMFELVEMYLKADKPSDIRQLACRGAIDEPYEMELPTLQEMRRALGAYASIQVAEEIR